MISLSVEQGMEEAKAVTQAKDNCNHDYGIPV